MSKIRTSLIVAGIIGVGACIYEFPQLRPDFTYSHDFVTDWRRESITVRFESFGAVVEYRQGHYKRVVPLFLRKMPDHPAVAVIEHIELVNLPPGSDYTVSFTTNVPGCSAGKKYFSLPFESVKVESRYHTSIEGLIGFHSLRYPDCVRMTIARADGVAESHDLHFAQFE